MFIKKTAISCGFLLFFVVFLSIASFFADPTSTLFSIKRIQEYALLTLQPSPENKVTYYQTLLDRRLSDIEFVTMNKHYRYVLPTNLRYVATAGKLTQYVTSNAVGNKKEEVKKQLKTHKIKLDNISKKYVKEYVGDDQWRYYADSQNYLDTYIKELE